MNYKIVQLKKKYAIVESHTKIIIELFSKREDARQCARILNLGAGFDGWSPLFIATKERI